MTAQRSQEETMRLLQESAERIMKEVMHAAPGERDLFLLNAVASLGGLIGLSRPGKECESLLADAQEALKQACLKLALYPMQDRAEQLRKLELQ